jgi:hypothetical protein
VPSFAPAARCLGAADAEALQSRAAISAEVMVTTAFDRKAYCVCGSFL